MIARPHYLIITMLAVLASPAQAQGERSEKRTRVFLGPQIFPEYPGAKDMGVGPFLDISRSPAGTPFAFEAPDESVGFELFGDDRFAIGPAANLVRKRKAADTGGNLATIGRSIELGAFAEAWVAPSIRFRVEGRKGVNGHKGWVGDVSADYVVRDGDAWLVSVGPRVSLASARAQQAYFGVTPQEAAASTLPAFDPDGGIRSVGMTVGLLRQLSRKWGIAAYARYDRLVGDAARSPVTRSFGSRSQPSAGIALTYTFGAGS